MLANLTLDQWFFAGIALVVLIGILRRSLRAIIVLAVLWLIFYWPTMAIGGMIGGMAENYERATQAEMSELAPAEKGPHLDRAAIY